MSKYIIAIGLLTISTAVCAVGWISNNIAARAFLRYLCEKGYTLPTKEELRACVHEAAEQKFSKKF